MKNTLYLLILLPVFLVSCEAVPEASFYVDNSEPVVGQEIYFTNDSYNAKRFEWDFGDNTFSEEPDPVHVYTGSGTYIVTLTAYSKTGLSDQAMMEIEVLIPTLLEVEVLEYYDHYPVGNASVILYPTLSDWDNETNSITEGFTDGTGKVVFSHLDNFVYYVDVWEADHNNYTLRDEDVGFIRTDQIRPHEINRFVAYVDFVSGAKGTGVRDRTLKIKRLDRKAQ
jgi:PKD repeat protein